MIKSADDLRMEDIRVECGYVTMPYITVGQFPSPGIPVCSLSGNADHCLLSPTIKYFVLKARQGWRE
jgi:hypothetical protein